MMKGMPSFDTRPIGTPAYMEPLDRRGRPLFMRP
jgi:hypothetical protein